MMRFASSGVTKLNRKSLPAKVMSSRLRGLRAEFRVVGTRIWQELLRRVTIRLAKELSFAVSDTG